MIAVVIGQCPKPKTFYVVAMADGRVAKQRSVTSGAFEVWYTP
jgi:hypothetical protein